MDTLAVQLTLPTAKRVADFHRQVIAHVERTPKSRAAIAARLSVYVPKYSVDLLNFQVRSLQPDQQTPVLRGSRQER